MKHAIPFLALALAALMFFPACGDKAGGGGGIAAASIAGTWELDVAAVKKELPAAIEKEMEGKTEVEKAMAEPMLAMMTKMLDSMTMTVDIKADGTWTSVRNYPEPPTMKMTEEKEAGTWVLDGETLTVTSTEENGEKRANPKTRTGTWKGDEIRVRETGQPFDSVMRRK